jgi:hypothetical protein
LVSADVVSEIVEAFRSADYFSLKNKYMWGATDLPTYTTSISIGGKTKEVVDYAGQQVGMPESVSRLEETIDRLSGVERWTKGNAETVELTRFLLEHGADPFAKTDHGQTALDWAKQMNRKAQRRVARSCHGKEETIRSRGMYVVASLCFLHDFMRALVIRSAMNLDWRRRSPSVHSGNSI